MDEGANMDISVGMRLRSQVCTTEVIVVRVPDRPSELGCGGLPLIAADADVVPAAIAPGLDGGSLLGKRYTTAEPTGLELLVVKAGAGTLSADGVPLILKDAKPLPASD